MASSKPVAAMAISKTVAPTVFSPLARPREIRFPPIRPVERWNQKSD